MRLPSFITVLLIAQGQVSDHGVNGLVQKCNTDPPTSHICPDDVDNLICDVSGKFSEAYGSDEPITENDLFEKCISLDSGQQSCVAPSLIGRIEYFTASADDQDSLNVPENPEEDVSYIRVGFNFVEYGKQKKIKVEYLLASSNGDTSTFPVVEGSATITKVADTTTCLEEPMTAGSFFLYLPIQIQDPENTQTTGYNLKISFTNSDVDEWEGDFTLQGKLVSSGPPLTFLALASQGFISNRSVPRITHRQSGPATVTEPTSVSATSSPNFRPTASSTGVTSSPSFKSTVTPTSAENEDASPDMMYVLVGLAGVFVPFSGCLIAKKRSTRAGPKEQRDGNDSSLNDPVNEVGLVNENWESAIDNPLRIDSNKTTRSVSSRFLSLILPTWADRLSSDSGMKEKKISRQNTKKRKNKNKKKIDLENQDLNADDATEVGVMSLVLEAEAMLKHDAEQNTIPKFGRGGPPLLPLRKTKTSFSRKKKKKILWK